MFYGITVMVVSVMIVANIQLNTNCKIKKNEIVNPVYLIIAGDYLFV
jgi:hypothetical protein